MKRAVDIVGSLSLILIISPLLVVLSILIYINMGNPILFKQERPGLHGRPFFIYKFRTMVDIRNSEGLLLPGEERLTKLGKILRKYSLDELPQLFNVLRGDLSLIGPRPLLMEYLQLYTKEQMKRHEVKPGITGWAQINGRNAISWDQKFKLDIWYVENQSIWLDIRILFLTIKKVIFREGVNASNHYSMENIKALCNEMLIIFKRC